MNTENKPEMQAPARVPEFHFARLMHEDGIVVRSQYRSGGKIRREVQARLRIELTRETVRAVHEAPMVLAAVDTYMAALAAHHAKCEEIEARADEEHNDRVARWERDCQVADDRGEERPPRPKRLEPTKPKPPKLHEYKVHARSIEATKDDPQYLEFEVVGVDGAELYRMGRLRMEVRGCPVLRAVADRIDLIVTVRGEVTEDEWALIEATQREAVQAVSLYVDPDGSGQLVWNEALDTVPALDTAPALAPESAGEQYRQALRDAGVTRATLIGPDGVEHDLPGLES